MINLIRISVSVLAFWFSCVAQAQLTLGDGTVLSDNPFWIVSYIEVAAGSEDEARTLLTNQAEKSRAEPGNLRFDTLQRIGRPYHFVVLEAWDTLEARSVHAATDHTRNFRQALQPLLYAPYDERPHMALEAAALSGSPDANSVYVITHADVVPPEQFPPCNRRPTSEGPCGNQLIVDLAKNSRTHAGNLGFDVLTQANRGNHMTVVEVWQNSDAQAAHQIHPQTKGFRDAISGLEVGGGVNEDPQFLPNPLLGSLWDERLYRPF